MRQRILIGAWIFVALLAVSVPTFAQMPTIPSPPAVPTLPTVPSKDALLQQAKGMVSDLTTLKTSGKLAPAQVQQVDGLLPKATALTNDLQKPQIPTSKLAEYATTMKDLQQQLATLKSLVK